LPLLLLIVMETIANKDKAIKMAAAITKPITILL
jgi:hypothetical protein